MSIEKLYSFNIPKLAGTTLLSLVGSVAIGNKVASHINDDYATLTQVQELQKTLEQEQSTNKTQAEEINKLIKEFAEFKTLFAKINEIEQKLNLKLDHKQIIETLKKVKNSTVEIEATTYIKNPETGKYFIDPQTRQKVVSSSIGSGVISISGDNRYIITNAHNLEDLADNTFHVKLYNGSDFGKPVTFDAKSLILKSGKKAISPKDKHDLALLEIPKDTELSDDAGIKFRDVTKEPLEVGEFVIMIGSSCGLRDSVKFGIISHIDRKPTKENQNHYIQTDAGINEGDSGGLLCDLQGRLIGINTSKVTTGEEIGFAIRVDDVEKVIQEDLGILINK